MDLFLFLLGVAITLIAVGLLVVRLIKREPKKKVLILLVVGFVILVSGPAVGIANMTPEEKAAIEEKRLAKEKEKEEAKKAELEAEESEKKKVEELKRKEDAETKRKEVESEEKKEQELKEMQKEAEEAHQNKKEELEKKEQELKEREKALKKREQEEGKTKNIAKEKERDAEPEKLEGISEEDIESLYAVILSMILGSDGRISDVRPESDDDWSDTVIYVSNEWHFLSEDEQKTIVDTLGGEIRDVIIDVGLSNEPKINFKDEYDDVVAYSKDENSFLLNK